MRQIILDTETTGLEPEQGHRIIEIGCVELINRRKSGRTFHRYLRPDREVDRGAIQVHGLTNEFLAQQPRFADVVEELIEFISGAELIIHNAGQRNSLDALCKRYGIDNSHRELHGALLDAQILLDVYLAMTGGQTALILGESTESQRDVAFEPVTAVARPRGLLRVLRATTEELVAHERMLLAIDKSSGGKTVWKQLALAV
jgi:DNA polymerase-3 subunit epsilon